MRTVYAKVLLWCFGTLLFSLLAFVAISFLLSRGHTRMNPHYQRDLYLFQEAIDAYEVGGPGALCAVLRRHHDYFGIEPHLTNPAGVDLVSGQKSFSAFMKAPPDHPSKVEGRLAQVLRDRNARYRYIVLIPPPGMDWTGFLPYYSLILLAVAGLCWLLAVNIASPLRQLALTVDRFGAGDLSARVEAKRRDEIGDLARAFNNMADRLQTLLMAERRLLQDISHELRSPLARLSFAAELTRTAPDRNAAVARLHKEIARLTDLVAGLIHVTRAEGDFSNRNLSPVFLNNLVEEVAESCELEAVAKHCWIESAGASPVHLQGDPELLRRAVENVLRNAIRYAPESSAIDVQLDAQGSVATVAIRDRGPGVPEEFLPKIFKPFFRVDASRDSKTGGIGLGLAIAQRAVLLHHGQITAENADPGLRVTIAVPLADVEHA